VGQNNGIVSDDYVVPNDCVGSDMGVRADLRRGGDLRCGMNPGTIERGLVKEFDSPGEGEVRVLNAKCMAGNLRKRGLYQDCCSPGGAGQRSVLGIGDEGQFAWTCGFNGSNTGNVGCRVALKLGSEVPG